VVSLAGQGQQWLSEAPATIRKVRQMLPRKSGPMDDLQKTTEAVQDLAAADQTAEKPVAVEVQSADAAYAVLGSSSHFIAGAVIVFVLGYFLLALSETLLKQALATRPTFLEKRNIVELVREVESGISRYLLTITIINAGLGAATAGVMWLLGVPNPLLWGILAALLNYVPHVGAFLCMVVLFFVGTVTHQSLAQGALVAGAFVLLTSAESYFITPVVLSKSLRLSPLAVILAILFWGWLWGLAGGLMAAPLLTIAKIVCDQFVVLRPYAALLAGEVVTPEDSSPVPKNTVSQVA
jgi:predicted PurR-regulated permease PerM